jgi:hypothetical protein
MSDNAEIFAKILTFLAEQFALKENRQCVGVDLLYSPGGGFRDEMMRQWLRKDDPELFDTFVNVEKFAAQIVEIVEGEVDAKQPGRHRFVVRTHQAMGGRAFTSIVLQPTFRGGGDETALVPANGGPGAVSGGPNQLATVLASHASQLMRINAGMFDSTIRVLGQQSVSMHQQVAELTTENIALRRELDDARSNKMEREFQLAMGAEKNKRANEGFQKLLQIGTVVAAKMGGDDGSMGSPSGLAMLLHDFGKSLRSDQIAALMNVLDMGQKMLFMEIMNTVAASAEAKASAGAAPGNNGAPSPGSNSASSP